MPSTALPLRSLGTAELLRAFDGPEPAPVARALALLAQATGLPEEELARWSVGRRDANLLHLRAQLLGPSLQALAPCPACGEVAEVAFPFDAVLSGPAEPEPPALLNVGGLQLRLRLPTSEDQLALAACIDADTARHLLLHRCVEGASSFDQGLTQAVADAMAQADPDADIQLVLDCPACGHRWSQILDVPAFVLAETRALAQRLLQEVHLLASAYGWSERDILALSPWRRQAYLGLVAP